ncbi:hypothetical protein [Actinoplanes xinjiangensis]|uniref:hypothetical protein n=1 Tax=Actinoplanes xinjiangensis TaxID=512350 RepID=UPI00341FB539
MWDDILMIAGAVAAILQALTAVVTLVQATRGRVNSARDETPAGEDSAIVGRVVRR